MKATLVFESHESKDLSIGMVFVPCICWVINEKIILNPHRNNPNFQMGDFQNLLDSEYLASLKNNPSQNLVIIVHPNGHGTQEDIDNLIHDAELIGYKVTTLYLSPSQKKSTPK